MKIEFDGETNTITVDDVPMSLNLLKVLSNPHSGFLYRFVRVGNKVDCTRHVSLTEYVPDGMIQ